MSIDTNYLLVQSILCDIFRHEMNLDQTQTFDVQGFVQPQDDKLYISVVEIDTRQVSVYKRYITTETTLQEKIISQHIGLFSIDLYSNANIQDQTQHATFRKKDLLFALASTYARQIMDLYGINISQVVQSMVNTSETAGSSIVNLIRYTTTLSIAYSSQTIKNIDYFNQFSQTGLFDK
jgi:hypothetical protein